MFILKKRVGYDWTKVEVPPSKSNITLSMMQGLVDGRIEMVGRVPVTHHPVTGAEVEPFTFDIYVNEEGRLLNQQVNLTIKTVRGVFTLVGSIGIVGGDDATGLNFAFTPEQVEMILAQPILKPINITTEIMDFGKTVKLSDHDIGMPIVTVVNKSRLLKDFYAEVIQKRIKNDVCVVELKAPNENKHYVIFATKEVFQLMGPIAAPLAQMPQTALQSAMIAYYTDAKNRSEG